MVLCLASISNAVSYSPLNPPSYPLAVRSPYLSGMCSLPRDLNVIEVTDRLDSMDAWQWHRVAPI